MATHTIALNIADLTRYDSIITSMMIAPHITQQQTVDPQPQNIDGDCVVLQCEDAQARAIVEFLRASVDTRLKQYAIRAYSKGPRGGWRKV